MLYAHHRRFFTDPVIYRLNHLLAARIPAQRGATSIWLWLENSLGTVHLRRYCVRLGGWLSGWLMAEDAADGSPCRKAGRRAHLLSRTVGAAALLIDGYQAVPTLAVSVELPSGFELQGALPTGTWQERAPTRRRHFRAIGQRPSLAHQQPASQRQALYAYREVNIPGVFSNQSQIDRGALLAGIRAARR